jgi:sugar phosphate isomerase/epimerase
MSEPPEDALETIDKLCEEYGINLAVHNHAKPSHYWSPDTVLSTCQGRSKRIGACADTGHWMRSGINPVEALKKLEGRIINLHFKDLNEYGMKGHDVPWGTGVGDAKAMLAEVYRQKLKAFFAVEYEYNWENSLPEIAQCVAFFDKAAAEWAAWDVNWPAPRAAPKSR